MSRLFNFFLTTVGICCVIVGSSQSQNDSLQEVWTNTQLPDSSRLSALHSLGQNLSQIQPDSGLIVAAMLENLATEWQLPSFKSAAILIKVESYLTQGNYEVVIRTADQALSNGDIAPDSKDKVNMLSHKAHALHRLGRRGKAIEIITTKRILCEQIGDTNGIIVSLNNIANVHLEESKFEKALELYQEALDLNKVFSKPRGTAKAITNMGTAHSYLENFDQAVEYLEKGLAQAQVNKDHKTAMSALLELAYIHEHAGKMDLAQRTLENAQTICQDLDYPEGESRVLMSLSRLHRRSGSSEIALKEAAEALEIATQINNPALISNAAKSLTSMYQEIGNHEQALLHYKEYVQAEDSIESQANQRSFIRQEYRYAYEKQAIADSIDFAKKDQIKTLQIANQESDIARQRIGLAATGGGLILIIALAVAIFRGKKKSDELLLNILPAETAAELKSKGHSSAKHIDQATVLFTDFQGFTSLSEKLTPAELVQDLNECFSAFDRIMEKYGVEKIKTIGDAYMAAGGLPSPNNTNALDVVKAALEIQNFMETIKNLHEAENRPYFEIRIGVHTGPVVAGIVGIKKFQYDIWGDTVNTASRLESSGDVGKVNISGTTYELVKNDDQFEFEFRGKVEAKGKGEIDMYYVEYFSEKSLGADQPRGSL